MSSNSSKDKKNSSAHVVVEILYPIFYVQDILVNAVNDSAFWST